MSPPARFHWHAKLRLPPVRVHPFKARGRPPRSAGHNAAGSLPLCLARARCHGSAPNRCSDPHHLKNFGNTLYWFSAVAADRVSIIQAWKAST